MTIEPVLGPRAQYFENECLATKTTILKHVAIILSQKLNPQDFVTMNIDAKEVSRLSDQDERTQILFKNILADVVNDITANRKEISIGLCMLSKGWKEMSVVGRFLRVTALPFVQDLALRVNAHDAEIIGEATSGGVHPTHEKSLKQFAII